MPPRAIILDFDGVIAKSMELHAEAYRIVLAPYDVRPSDEDVFAAEGARSETIIRECLERAGQDLPDEEIQRLADEKQTAFAKLGPAPLYPDAPGFVQRLATTGLPLGLVTGTRRENLERFVPDLLPLFHTILAQADYTHDKPHPEPYATASVRIGHDASECAVLENAVRGVQSARGAGIGRVVGITTTMPASELATAGAHRVVPDHQDAFRALTE